MEEDRKSKRKEDKEERRKRRKLEKAQKLQKAESKEQDSPRPSASSEQQSKAPSEPESREPSPRDSFIEPQDESIVDRVIDVIEKPRITPAQNEEQTSPSGITSAPEGPSMEASSVTMDDNHIGAESSSPSQPLLDESTLRSIVDAQYLQVSLQIDALESYRQTLAPYVSETIRSHHTRKRRSAATSPTVATSSAGNSTPKEKKKSGYLMFLAEMRASGEYEGRSKVDEKWRALSAEEKQKWSVRALSGGNEKTPDASAVLA